jgi:DNA-binding NarL/FixJ family response regulator
VLAGGVYLSSDLTQERSEDAKARADGRPSNSPGKLTERELEVFLWIGRGRTTKEIAREMALGIASIDTYRARIKEKLKLRNATELQHSAMRWVLETGQET